MNICVGGVWDVGCDRPHNPYLHRPPPPLHHIYHSDINDAKRVVFALKSTLEHAGGYHEVGLFNYSSGYELPLGSQFGWVRRR